MDLILFIFFFLRNELAQFYAAELVVAVTSVHDMGFIHRDIKPDNVLIGRDGHIKLTDFGLCTGFRWTHDSDFYRPGTQQTNKLHDRKKQLQRRKEAFSLVGTPNYIAPEVLQVIYSYKFLFFILSFRRVLEVDTQKPVIGGQLELFYLK